LFRWNLPWLRRSRPTGSPGLGPPGNRTYRYRDPLALAPIAREAIFKDQEGIFIAPPGRNQEFTMAMPEFHDFPCDAKLFSGFHNHTISYPPGFILNLFNVHLVGYRTLLTQDGFFLDDQAYVEEEHLERRLNWLATEDPFFNEDTGLVKSSNNRDFRLQPSGRPVIRLRGKVVVLCSHEPSVYGSFLFRVLPKLATLGRAPEGTKYLAYVGSDTMLGFLAMAGVPKHDIIRHDPRVIYQIDHAIVPSMRNQQGLLDDVTLSFFANMRRRFGSKKQVRKIYVSRYNASSRRVMLNERKLIKTLRSIGFDIVEPQKLSAEDQIRMFSSADIVVGPAGSGMFNAVFCHPGTRLIDIESEPHWIHAHMGLFGSLELRYGIFEGQRVINSLTPHQSFEVNIDALMRRIGSFV
jgi:hypothetical protein